MGGATDPISQQRQNTSDSLNDWQPEVDVTRRQSLEYRTSIQVEIMTILRNKAGASLSACATNLPLSIQFCAVCSLCSAEG